jgi:hypothetical protein
VGPDSSCTRNNDCSNCTMTCAGREYQTCARPCPSTTYFVYVGNYAPISLYEPDEEEETPAERRLRLSTRAKQWKRERVLEPPVRAMPHVPLCRVRVVGMNHRLYG